MTKKSKELNSNDFEIAQLIAQGASEAEILRVFGKSRSTLSRLKSRPDFEELVSQAKQGLKTAIAESSQNYARQAHLEKLEKYRQDGERLGGELLKTGSMLLQLINTRLETTESSDLSINQIASHLKGTCAALDSGFELTSRSLGVDQMMEIFYSIE